MKAKASNLRKATATIVWLAVAALMVMFAPAGHAGQREAEGNATPWEECFRESGARHGVSVELLKGIARVESGFNRKAVSPVGAMGVMQIDKSWLPKLAKHGITKDDLWDACTNIDVGAWVIGSELKARGDTWEAVGAYNAACTKLKGQACTAQRAKYSWQVFSAMKRDEGAGPQRHSHGPRGQKDSTARAGSRAVNIVALEIKE